MNTLQNNKISKRMYKSLVFSILLSAFCFTNMPEANAQSYWGEVAKKAVARAEKEAKEKKALEEKKQRDLEAQRLKDEMKVLEGKYKDEINKEGRRRIDRGRDAKFCVSSEGNSPPHLRRIAAGNRRRTHSYLAKTTAIWKTTDLTNPETRSTQASENILQNRNFRAMTK